VIGYCDRFWGSHGCSLPEGHRPRHHECRSTMRDVDGVMRPVICSQMQEVDDKGAGRVRFRILNEERWSDWSPWSRFTNRGSVK
jgi:hypothetical protein